MLFVDLFDFVAGERGELDALLDDPEAVIISEGLAEHLAVALGDTIKVTGEGTDHVVNARIIAIARLIPSISGIGRSRTAAQSNSDALMSLDGFRELITELKQPLPPADKPILDRVMITLSPNAVAREVADEMGKRFRQDYSLWTRFTEVQIEQNRRAQATQRIFLLVLTTISFTTAVFGVFSFGYLR